MLRTSRFCSAVTARPVLYSSVRWVETVSGIASPPKNKVLPWEQRVLPTTKTFYGEETIHNTFTSGSVEVCPRPPAPAPLPSSPFISFPLLPSTNCHARGRQRDRQIGGHYAILRTGRCTFTSRSHFGRIPLPLLLLLLLLSPLPSPSPSMSPFSPL